MKNQITLLFFATLRELVGEREISIEIPDGTNDCQAGVSTDQRGAVRADGVSRGGSACEIGAYEFDSTPITNFIYLPLVLKHY